MNTRYLTKSRFQLAMECPAKLCFEGKPEYSNHKLKDSFLDALAEGGFQVGALAMCYFPDGYQIETLDYNEAIRQTDELLKQDKVIIYEAAFHSGNFFIRVDILIKNGQDIELVEVKAKSFDPNTDKFLTKKGTISSSWRSYLSDAAFQKFVFRSVFPDYNVSTWLMLADKTAVCPTDGLNQKFKIKKDETGRKTVSVSPDLTPKDLSMELLTRVNVDDYCDLILNDAIENEYFTGSYAGHLDYLAEQYAKDQKIMITPSASCASCEFTATEEEMKAGLKSGFHECWIEGLNWTDKDLKEPTVLDIWNYRKKNKCISEGRIKLCDITEEDISPKSDDKPGLSSTERQWLQVKKTQSNDTTYWIDSENLKKEIDSWNYPLHFIDFETSMVAIPFNMGRHPYEGIAFQFSHHLVHEDGRVEHHGQYLNVSPGVFPNYEFARRIKKELDHDEGSIFRYAAHENTFLNIIYQQLIEDQNNIPDNDALCEFIRTITSSSKENWTGPRNMIDMLDLVKRYYYHPAVKGSNSIKKVLPAILNSSEFLKKKYAEPIYGADGGIPSLNFQDWQWITYANGEVVDPYKLLPRMFKDIPDEEMDLLSENDELREGGAALTAYARLQFEEMSDYERTEIKSALLKYCELDTLAMVMIFEGWKDFIDHV